MLRLLPELFDVDLDDDFFRFSLPTETDSVSINAPSTTSSNVNVRFNFDSFMIKSQTISIICYFNTVITICQIKSSNNTS